MKTPRWAVEQEQERAPLKAARLAALLLLKQQGRIPDLPKTQIAEALGISRWTLDRDLATLDIVAAEYKQISAALARLPLVDSEEDTPKR